MPATRPGPTSGSHVRAGTAGGGPEVSLSLRETTALCVEITGRRVEVVEDGSDRPGDTAR